MSDYVLGAHILESLTIGMYQDSRIIFREYIQNACDSIDAAVKCGVLAEGEGEIRIEIDPEARNILIEDNGTGIKAADFVKVMGNVAASEKDQRENKGFRGIGKLCGMAYCAEVVFTSKFRGESAVSVLRCNAKILREFFGDKDSGLKQESAQSVLATINEFSSERTEDIDGHYFRVELLGINEENEDLTDCGKVKEYLSFAAPLPYHMGFAEFSARIHRHAWELGQRIDEYDIFLNGDQLFKMYSRKFVNGRGNISDEIFDISFEDFRDIKNNLVAWMWYGISHFKGAIDDKCRMRGIRLRKDNIQIGDADTMRRFFAEARGNSYFVGEVFCVSEDFTPNARRDYFNENKQRNDFEHQLLMRFKPLTKLYHDGSAINSSLRKISEAQQKSEEFAERMNAGSFANDDEVKAAKEEVQLMQEEAASAEEKLQKIRAEGSKLAVSIIRHIEYSAQEPAPSENHPQPAEAAKPKRTQKELRLISQIFDIIKSTLPSETANLLITKIQDKLK